MPKLHIQPMLWADCLTVFRLLCKIDLSFVYRGATLLAFNVNQKKYLLTLLVGISACSAKPDSDGKPSLNCADASIPDSNYVIERLRNIETATITCGGIRDLPGPALVQFRVYELVTIGSSLPGGGSADDGAGIQASQPIKLPRAGIAFTPSIGSQLNLSAVRTASEFQVDSSKCDVNNPSPECTISPYEYLGVVTPSSEWCSDSTGVISYQFWISCNGNSSSFAASVTSGGIKVDDGYSYTVTNETAAP